MAYARHWPVQLRSKVFLNTTSSFRSFILSCCSLILLLPSIASSEGLIRYGTSNFGQVQLLVSLLVNIFSTATPLPALIVLRTLANLLQQFLPEQFLVLYFLFSQFLAIISSTFFLKFMTHLYFLKCCSVFGISTHKWWVYYPLNGRKRTGMISYNHPFLVCLGQQCKVHFYPTFQLPSDPLNWPSHFMYEPFIKSNELYLFRYKYWSNHL